MDEKEREARRTARTQFYMDKAEREVRPKGGWGRKSRKATAPKEIKRKDVL